MRDCQLVTPSDVLKVAVVPKGSDDHRIVVFADDECEWLTSDRIAGLQRSIAARVHGLKDETVQVRHLAAGKCHIELVIDLPDGTTHDLAVRYMCRIKEVIKDQPKITVYSEAERKSAYVNHRVRMAAAS